MHVNLFDPYKERISPIHQRDPAVKIALTVLFVLSTALLPDGAWVAFALSWGVVLLATALGRLPLSYPIRRSVIALPFALAAITLLFTVPGRPLLGGQIGAWRWSVTEPGLVRFTSVLVRSWLSVQMAVLLTATTPFPEIVRGLNRIGVPEALVGVIGLMYRYLFLLADEALRLLRARASRSGGAGQGALRWRARVAGHMAGQLFTRSYARSERVYAAMLARGFDGRILSLPPARLRAGDVLLGGLTTGLLACIQLYARL